MSYHKNYTVTVGNINTYKEYTYENLGLEEAKKIAKEEAAKDENNKVFISTYRKTDGQTLYYNRDGFGPVGQSW